MKRQIAGMVALCALIYGVLLLAIRAMSQEPPEMVVDAFSLERVPASHVLAASYGDRNSTTLTNLIQKLSNRACIVILDGVWSVSNNVTFPTNIMATFAGPGSYLDGGTNSHVVCAFNGVVDAGPFLIWTGNANATGKPSFLYRWPAWGGTNLNLGDGPGLGTNYSFAMVEGTTGDFVWATADTVTAYRVSASDGHFLFLSATNANMSTATVGRMTLTTGTLGRITVNGENLTPMANFATITITNGTPSVAIQAQLDAADHWMPWAGFSKFVYFEPGYYTMSNSLMINAGGSPGAAIRIVGGTSWTNFGLCRTNQTVTLDFSGVNGHGLHLLCCDSWLICNDIHFKANTALTSSAYYAQLHYGDATFFGCYFEGNTTNAGALITANEGRNVWLYSNVFGNARIGVAAGPGVTVISSTSSNAPGQSLRYAYGRWGGGQIWTNQQTCNPSRMTGCVGVVYDETFGAIVP